MAFYATLWFWAFIIGIVLFVIGIVFYDYDRNRTDNPTPFWVWTLIVLGIVFLIVGLLIYVLTEPSNIEICCGSWRQLQRQC